MAAQRAGVQLQPCVVDSITRQAETASWPLMQPLQTRVMAIARVLVAKARLAEAIWRFGENRGLCGVWGAVCVLGRFFRGGSNTSWAEWPGGDLTINLTNIGIHL